MGLALIPSCLPGVEPLARLSMAPLGDGRLQLTIGASAPDTFEVSMSRNLDAWEPYLQVSAGAAASAFTIEVPASHENHLYRVHPRPELGPLLKPMVVVPGGTYLMGQEAWYAGVNGMLVGGPVHSVTLSPFTMDAHEVTLAEWRQVVAWATNAARGDRVYDLRYWGDGDGPNNPVVMIDWYHVLKWANARSEMEGRPPAYFTSESRAVVYRTGTIEVRNDWVDWDGGGYRLPTEAEWEYAGRGGLAGKIYAWGDESPDATRCNFAYQINHTTPVGSYPPNGYGLFDMAGNVREWCWDLHVADPAISYTNHIVYAPYDPEPQTNPRGPYTGPRGMSRGGGWVDWKEGIQVGRRHNDERYRVTNFTGFRLARSGPTALR